MPSTYSPDLRIELIANGEQSGTWGATTNSNLGTLIEDAISGLASVSVTTANQALTALNGAADQARCAAISLSTLTTANFNVYVPPVTKLYVVKNTTAYVATIYCSTVLGNTTAAGTGVAIPAGKSVLLRSDGTNIVEQLDHINSLSLGTALAVSSGGTGATSLTANNVLLGNGTSAVQVVAPGTSGNVLTSNGTTWVSGAGFVTGMIIMWSGTIATIPSGWALCNGSGGTPDLRDRFIIGARQDDAGVAKTNITGSLTQTGGSKDAIVVSHSHTTDTAGSHAHTIKWTQFGEGGGTGRQFYTPFSGSNLSDAGVTTNGSHTHTISTTGSSGTNANLVPYYALAFIMKT